MTRLTRLTRTNPGPLGKTRCGSLHPLCPGGCGTGAAPAPQPAQMFWLAVRADGIGRDGVMPGCGELAGTGPWP